MYSDEIIIDKLNQILQTMKSIENLIANSTNEKPLVQPIKNDIGEVLTTKEAAQYLGLKEQTLCSWRCHGLQELPYVKSGRLVRYRKKDLNEYIQRNMKANTSQY